MAVRTVTGTLLNIKGNPYVDAKVRFSLAPFGLEEGGTAYPRQEQVAITDSTGAFEIALWVSEDSSKEAIYTCVLPSGERFRFILPEGSVPTGNIIVSGAGTESANGVYSIIGELNSRPLYENGGGIQILWTGGVWSIGLSGLYSSTDNVATPDLVDEWGGDIGELPVPTVTAELVSPPIDIETLFSFYSPEDIQQQPPLFTSFVLNRQNHTNVQPPETISPVTANTVLGRFAGTNGSAQELALAANRFAARASTGNVEAKPITDTALGILANPLTAPISTATQAALDNIVASQVSGRVIYVDPQNANATDTRTGLSKYSRSNPFVTLGAANTASDAGDTVVLLPGNYSSSTALTFKANVSYDSNIGVSNLPLITIGGDFFTSVRLSGVWTGNLVVTGSCSAPQATFTGNLITISGGFFFANHVESGITMSGGLCGINTININTKRVIVNGASPITSFIVNVGGFIGYDDDPAFSFSSSAAEVSVFLNNVVVRCTKASSGDISCVGLSPTQPMKINLKDCFFIVEATGVATPYSITSGSSADVYIQGTLSQTHEPNSNITLIGGSSITNGDFSL